MTSSCPEVACFVDVDLWTIKKAGDAVDSIDAQTQTEIIERITNKKRFIFF